MEWFWVGLYGGLGYAMSGIAVLLGIAVMVFLWAGILIVVDLIRRKERK